MPRSWARSRCTVTGQVAPWPPSRVPTPTWYVCACLRACVRAPPSDLPVSLHLSEGRAAHQRVQRRPESPTAALDPADGAVWGQNGSGCHCCSPGGQCGALSLSLSLSRARARAPRSLCVCAGGRAGGRVCACARARSAPLCVPLCISESLHFCVSFRRCSGPSQAMRRCRVSRWMFRCVITHYPLRKSSSEPAILTHFSRKSTGQQSIDQQQQAVVQIFQPSN